MSPSPHTGVRRHLIIGARRCRTQPWSGHDETHTTITCAIDTLCCWWIRERIPVSLCHILSRDSISPYRAMPHLNRDQPGERASHPGRVSRLMLIQEVIRAYHWQVLSSVQG